MKASLPQRLRERRRHTRRRRSRRAITRLRIAAHSPARRASDPSVERARDAGGPLDRASYSCQCGYVFMAPVSTSVSCPNCKAGQVW